MAIAAHRSHSAGLLIYRRRAGGLDVLLARPGGPWWRNRDAGAWQIPKGRIEPGEDPEAAAFREAQEELGVRLTGDAVALGIIKQAGGKRVAVWALEQELDPATFRSNEFELEWPPKSGKIRTFPEIEEARWFDLAEARLMILPSQGPLLDALERETASVR
ncbi:NUDIX domain-containing protein [Sphingomonas sp. MMSM20]|uniref:NUDIX domain-containing protein n=1 Tax=Sphingomonas lycopersici TaxID=2951807 RepID=UPI0022372883|nr:NUDIX domain-containing protein [Sphingomonas lycopersici]MCW6530180.1 NUDIX domain-containing protein [Sphingomonas lycopersici]